MNPSDAIVVSGLISFIGLIVFFVMASNIGAIRKKLDATLTKSNVINYASLFIEGEKQEYLGKKDKALDCYNEAYYLLHKYLEKNTAGSNEIVNKTKIEEKITSLGGTIKEVPK